MGKSFRSNWTDVYFNDYFFIQSVLLITLSFTGNSVLIFIIIVIYGVTLWGVPTIINASVSEYIHPKYLPIGMGFVTVFLGVGQLVSPAFTGYLIEYSNSYFSALIYSSVTALLGGFGCMKLIRARKKQAKISKLQVEMLKEADM